MGLQMAQQLIANGYSVRGSDLSVPAMRSFVDAGGVACDHPAEAASSAAVVITMLPDGGVVDTGCWQFVDRYEFIGTG